MPYQHPLVVRYDDEGRADGLKETNFLVVSSISAADWVGLPVAGGGLAVSDAEVGQIYFREDAGSASGIPLPNPNTSGYLNVSTNNAGEPVYSWGPGGAAGIPPYSVNATGDPDAESVWTFNGLNAEFITPTELNTALGSYAQTTALDAFVEIDDAGATNEIYYKSGDNTADGIVAPDAAGTYLSWNGTGFAWQTPAGASPPVQSTTEASLWYFSGISGIAVSAVSAASGAFIGKAVFTGPRQVIYSTPANTPAVTTAGGANQVLSIDGPATTVVWRNLSELPALTAIDSRVGTIEANYVSSEEFDQLTTSAAQISAVVNTINSTYITTAAANAAYVNVNGDTMTGALTVNNNLNVTGNVVVTGTSTFQSPVIGIDGTEITVTKLGGGNPAPVQTIGFNIPAQAASTVEKYVQQVDGLLHLHTYGFLAPTGTDTPGHWNESQLINVLKDNFASATTSALSGLSDTNITTTPLDNYILAWSSAVAKWIVKENRAKVAFPQAVGEGDIEDPNLANHILILSSNLSDVEVSNWNISSIELHLGNINQVDGTEIHHYLSSLDQRYVNLSGDTMTGDLNVPTVSASFISGVDYIQFDTNVQSETAEGRITWDDTFKTLIVGTAAGSLFRLGQEVSLRVRNKTGGPLYKGQVVYVSGVETNLPTVALASASAEASTHKGMGILKQDIPNNNQGLMMLLGKIFDIDTSIYSPGDVLYLGTTPGSFTNVYAQAPNHPELIGAVLESDAINGSLLVTIQHGYEINELHNVSRTPASATGQVLVWNDTSGYYQPGSHNDLAGLTTGNPHTQYATLSGATFTGQVLIPSGSSVAPGLAFSNSTNTGLIHTTNRLTSVVGGTNQFSITTGGAYDFFSDSALLRLGQVGDVTLSRTGTGTLQIASSVYVPLTLSAGTVRATTVSATTYQNLPTDVRPLPFTIFNPTSGLVVPLFYGKDLTNINEIQSVLVGGTSASWSIYETADASDPEGGTEIISSQTTNSTTSGNNHSGSTFTENWIVLKIHTVSGAITQLHLTLLTN